MSRIRFVTSTDEHVADLAPGFRKDDYRAAILGKLAWQGELARKVGAAAVLRGGDLFHVKAANKTTHATVQMVADVHSRFPCPEYVLAGNHDMSNNDPESVLRQQPLGVLIRTGLMKELRDESFEDGSLSVRVVGVEYTTDLALGGLMERVKKIDDRPTIAVVHALAAMAPEERTQSFFNEHIFDYRDLVFPGCPDVYVFGHYHKDQGVVDHLGVKFVNLGAVSRGALTFENLERRPKSSIITIDSSGVNVESIEIPCEDASAIFDLDLKKRLDHERRSLDDFIRNLRADSGSVASASDMRQQLAEYPDDVRSLALEVLEAAEAGVLDES